LLLQNLGPLTTKFQTTEKETLRRNPEHETKYESVLAGSLVWKFQTSLYKNCFLLGYYIGSYGNSLPTYRDNLSVGGLHRLTDQLSRKVDKELALFTVQ